MDDGQTNDPAAPAEGETCGCSCEFCMSGNHDQCQTGLCSIKKNQQAPENPPEEPK